ncbi:hypothetical protein CER19_01835 [Pseudomonas sp. GL93]|nr:hypothetical protein CER19_01835 [Pseudomonas sp. GL93]
MMCRRSLCVREQARSHIFDLWQLCEKHKGDPKVPFNLSLPALFLLLRGGLLLFLVAVARTAFFATPIRGQEQTYFFER